MRNILASLVCLVALNAFGQTAEELVAKNLQAKGGVEKIKALKTVKLTGNFENGGFKATIGTINKRPDLVKESFSLQGMTQVQAYDGSKGWQISPFSGRRDPELLGEDDMRDLVEQADFYGPLIDYREKGH